MKKGYLKKIVICALTTLMVASSAFGCGKKDPETSPSPSTGETTAPAGQTDTPKEVTIKFFSNLPDRAAGMGKLEQTLIDNYMNENKNVKIVVEALQDEPYKQKFKAYSAGNELPDIYMVWGQPAFFNPIMQGGYAAELNASDYSSYNFFNGSLNGFSMDGKLYGLPRNTDFMVIFYNKKLFADNGIKVPATYEELLDAAKAFRGKGISPLAMNGKDKWAMNILFQDLVIKEGGNQQLVADALAKKIKFSEDPVLVKAAQRFKELTDIKFFQDGFISADYGAAQNVFAQEKAAMYYMGAWEMGMKTNESFSQSFRDNLGVIKFPGMTSGKGKATDMMSWNGGGYAVSADSAVKDEAVKLLNYIMKPENWSKNAWQSGLGFPAQKLDAFMTGNETDVQKELIKILGESTSASGTPWNDAVTPNFKTDAENIIQELAAGVITPEEFGKKVDDAVAKEVK
jgi:raffinose/stachyose/melibiose transport system substrate-binding protein